MKVKEIVFVLVFVKTLISGGLIAFLQIKSKFGNVYYYKELICYLWQSIHGSFSKLSTYYTSLDCSENDD